jgi:uncharacterized protein (TIGR02268 family)
LFASYSIIVLAWGLLLASVADAAEPGTPETLVGVRRIDIKETRESLPEIHIGPGLSTTVLFDSPIRPDEVVLEGRERFQRLGMSEDHLVLVPSSTFRHGEQLRLEVRFRDGAAPERAAFMLVMDAAHVDRQVELYRQARTAESYRQEVEELKRGMAQLRQEVARLHPSNAPAGDSDYLPAIITRMDDITKGSLTYGHEDSSAPVSVMDATYFRLPGHWMALRVRLALRGRSGGWTAAAASLSDAQGRAVKVLRPWQEGSVTSEMSRDVVVAIEDEVDLPAGRYTLKLWDEGGGQSVMLEGLAVP